MKRWLLGFMCIGLCVFIPVISFAVPVLQLDISGGVYSGPDYGVPQISGQTNDTIVATSENFSLYALLRYDQDPDKLPDLGPYYISAAVYPDPGSPLGLGSFDIDLDPYDTIGPQTINVVGDMTYGTPPHETVMTQLYDPGDLSPHDIFETYFAQFEFYFSDLDRALLYNSAPGGDPDDPPGTPSGPGGPTPDPDGTLLYKEILIDTSNLVSGVVLHFDLYNQQVCDKAAGHSIVGDIDIDDFAPYSHDAESHIPPVPEPATLLLMGSGLLAFGGYRKRKQ